MHQAAGFSSITQSGLHAMRGLLGCAVGSVDTGHSLCSLGSSPLLRAETRGGRYANGGPGAMKRLSHALGLPLRTALLVGTLAAALGTVGLIEQVGEHPYLYKPASIMVAVYCPDGVCQEAHLRCGAATLLGLVHLPHARRPGAETCPCLLTLACVLHRHQQTWGPTVSWQRQQCASTTWRRW
jgi:hypothetical protein